MVGIEWLKALQGLHSGWRERVAPYFAAVLLFYVPVAGSATRGMSSMIRFSVCFHVPLVLAAAHLLHRFIQEWRWIPIGTIAAWQGAIIPLHLIMAYRFTHGLWVA